jgi:hypothetical protein
MAPGAAAAAQNGTASFGGIAVQKAMLAFAPDFRRLILAFHVIILSRLPRSSRSNTSSRGESAFRSLKRYRQDPKCQPRKLRRPRAARFHVFWRLSALGKLSAIETIENGSLRICHLLSSHDPKQILNDQLSIKKLEVLEYSFADRTYPKT